MQPLMTEQQQARWRLRAKTRREQGLPAATARQMLFFVLSYHHLGTKHEGTNALFSLMRLRDKCVTEPIKQSTMQGFLNMWDRNMMQPTAHQVSQVDLERLFYEALEHCQYSEVQHELRFYKEGPMPQSDLRRRIDKVLRTKEISESRKAHERSLNDALSLGPAPKQPRGHAGKKGDGQPKTEPKTAKDAKSSSNAVDGGTPICMPSSATRIGKSRLWQAKSKSTVAPPYS